MSNGRHRRLLPLPRLLRRSAGLGDDAQRTRSWSPLAQEVAELRLALRREAERGQRLEALCGDLAGVVTSLATATATGGAGERERLPAPEGPPRIFTVVTRAMLPAATVLARSVRRLHPEWTVQAVLLGPPAVDVATGADAGDGAGDAALTVTAVADALSMDPELLLAFHSADELVTILAPRLLLAHCEAGGGPAIHLPAGAWALAPLHPLLEPLRAAPLVLAPRRGGGPPHDGLQPDAGRLRAAGRVTPDLIAVDGSPRAGALLRDWIGRLDLVLGAPDGGLGHDPADRSEVLRALEVWLGRTDVTALTDPAVNLSAWNISEHVVAPGPAGVTVDGAPLRLIDLTGFDPGRPYQLAPWASRVRLSRVPVLAGLAERYAAELTAAGWNDAEHRRDEGRGLPGGLTFDAALQSLFATAHTLGAELGDPISPPGAEAFTRWLRGPAPRGGAHGVTRHLLATVLRDRRDVALAFPDLDGADGPALVAWALAHGRAELGIPERLMPAAPDPVAAPAAAVGAASGPPRGAAGDAPRVRVSGYLGDVIGLGAAARAYATALQAAGVPVSTLAASLRRFQPPVALAHGYGRHGGAADAEPTDGGDGSRADGVVHEEATDGVELICVNPPELPAFLAALGPQALHGRRIGVWGWETSTIPPQWGPALHLVDEVWVYSRFVAANLAALTELPVRVMPPPVALSHPAGPPLRLGVPDGFLFLFILDYSSSTARKNPVGVIEAFTRAFAPGEGPQLLIKTLNAPLLPLAEEEVLWAARGRPDIHVVDRSLTGDERDRLIAACDCYVSLHRSEGFGLTMAEAMAAGKPVIATAYSGNLEFMTADNSHLVDYALTRVGPGVPIYPADGEWAEPDLDHAARLMRAVHDSPATAARLGERARLDIAAQLSPAVVGARLRARLVELAGEPAQRHAGAIA